MGRFPRISPGFAFFLAAMVLLVPIGWVQAVVQAAAFHELCHLIAIRLCSPGTKIGGIRATGVRIDLPEMGRRQELICALAGPVGGLLLLALWRQFPKTAFCALCQSAYNLLPIYPLDGGRAAMCLYSMLLPPPGAARAMQVTQWVSLSLVCLACGYAAIAWEMGWIVLCVPLLLLFRQRKWDG